MASPYFSRIALILAGAGALFLGGCVVAPYPGYATDYSASPFYVPAYSNGSGYYYPYPYAYPYAYSYPYYWGGPSIYLGYSGRWGGGGGPRGSFGGGRGRR